MDQATTYALLSAVAYEDARFEPRNRAPIPPGWHILEEFSESGSGANASWLGSGFTARVFQGPAGQIVVAYAGTEFRLTEAGGITDFTSGNVPLAAGLYGEQGFQAALLYQRVQARFGASADISFTGHSLGGGLAGLMGVWFDRPATVFDPAPFEASADQYRPAATRTRQQLADLGYHDPKFDNYRYATDFSARESHVASYAISGEILESIPLLSRIETNRQSFLAGAAPRLDSGTRHSIDMLAAVLLLPAFKDAATALPELLPTMFNKNLYGQEVLGLTPNLLMRLIRNEVGVSDPRTGVQITAPNGLLTKFSADVQQLVQVDGGHAESTLRTALVTAAADFYYLKDPTAATALFTTTNNAVNFKFGDIGVELNTLKSPRALANAVWSLDDHGDVAESLARQMTAWHVQSGSGAMSWADADGLDDAAIGGTGGDMLDAGAGLDLLMGLGGNDTLKVGAGTDALFGGEGNDELEGGAGSDSLYGGAGTDVYKFSGVWNSDRIEDSGGDGVIIVVGLPEDLTGDGAKKVSATANTWQSDDDKVTYTTVNVNVNVSARRTDLVITVDAGSATRGSITVRNWSDGQLGIRLGSEVDVAVTSNSFTGDFTKATNGSEYLISDGRYSSAGTQANAQDLVNGSADADSLSGLGGNDVLSMFLAHGRPAVFVAGRLGCCQ